MPSSKGASTSGMERRQVGRTNRWFSWVTSFAHTLQRRQNRYLGWPHAQLPPRGPITFRFSEQNKQTERCLLTGSSLDRDIKCFNSTQTRLLETLTVAQLLKKFPIVCAHNFGHPNTISSPPPSNTTTCSYELSWFLSWLWR